MARGSTVFADMSDYTKAECLWEGSGFALQCVLTWLLALLRR